MIAKRIAFCTVCIASNTGSGNGNSSVASVDDCNSNEYGKTAIKEKTAATQRIKNTFQLMSVFIVPSVSRETRGAGKRLPQMLYAFCSL
jgi:hypothetical protein